MRVLLLLLCFVQFVHAGEGLWSKTGHRVTGAVAENYLNRRAKRAVAKLLDGQSLAAVSTFGDEIKADSKYRKYSPWHYVNFPLDEAYGESAVSAYGDVVMGINTCISVIKDTSRPRADRVFHLKLLVHLLGDLHQPMHVGRAADKGGNDIQLQWFGKGTNLHRLWDSNMINDYGMSYTELTDKLPTISKKQVKFLMEGDVYSWVEESQELAAQVYESVEAGEQLGYRYGYVWWATVEKQLQKGGIRLAAVLNAIF